MSFSHLFLSLSPETEYGRGGPLIQCVFLSPAISGNCGLGPEGGGQVNRKREDQGVLIELGKQAWGVIGKKGVL